MHAKEKKESWSTRISQRVSVYTRTIIVRKDANEGQLHGLWVSMRGSQWCATTFALELIAVSITPAFSLSLSPVSVFLVHSHCNTAPHRIANHRGDTRCGRHVKSTLETTSHSRRKLPPHLSVSPSLSRLDIYLTMQRNVIPDRRPYPGGIPIAELHYIVARRKQWRASLVWSANCSGSDVWSSREEPSGKDYPYSTTTGSGESVISIARKLDRAETLIECHLLAENSRLPNFWDGHECECNERILESTVILPFDYTSIPFVR